MYLESVILQGFKSFPEKTKLEFLSSNNGRKSITAIVGPNGSGKSNISDAIRWVMGEQSLSKLRAKTNEDIIFNGSENKRKTGRASVKIVLDNSDGEVDIDQEKVTIERKFYRSGESQYLLNGEEVRLLDLKLFLAEANFAQSSYSVIGQGMVNNIVTQTPKERKDFFDEAFGIKEHQIKRHQAWLKLQRSKDNIQEIKMLLKEKQPRLNSLKKKVDKLERKKELSLKLTELRESYYSSVYKKNKEKKKTLQSRLDDLRQQEEKIEKKINELKQELAKLAENKKGEDFDQLQKEYQNIINQKNKLEEEKAVLQGKLQTEYSNSGQKNIGWIENKVSSLKDEKKQARQEVKELDDKIQAQTDKIKTLQQDVEEVQYKKTAVEGKASNLEQKINAGKDQTQFTSIRAIDELIKNRNKFDGFKGMLAQLGEVEDKFELAVDIAAGSHLSSLVVSNENTAQACIDYLKENNLGYATFLPLSKLQPRVSDISRFNHPKIYDLALNLVSFSGGLTSAFKYALGSTLIVEDVQTAKEVGIGQIRMVTLEGDIFNKSGSITGGKRKKKRKLSFSQPNLNQENINKKREKLKRRKKELEELEQQEQKLKQTISQLKEKRQENENRKELLEEKKKVLTEEVEELESELSMAQMDVDEYSEKLEQLRGRKDELEQKINEYEQQAQQLKQKIDKFNRKEEQKKEKIFSMQDELQEQQLDLKDIQTEINQKEKQLTKIKTKQQDLSNEIREQLNCSAEDLIERGVEKLKQNEISEAKNRIQELKYKLELIGEIDPEVKDEYQQLKQEYDELKEQLQDLKEAMKDSKELIKELDQIMKEKRENSFKEIKDKFDKNFKTLFKGGEADLKRIYGEKKEKIDKSQEAIVGVEIKASPPEKKVDNIRSLSGGEKTMTALALICAIINTNPSPFIILDEVEASLDEANTSRFIDILEELAEQSQFILITHNRTTMHAADALYGVTMNSGVSEVVSLKLEEAEKVSE